MKYTKIFALISILLLLLAGCGTKESVKQTSTSTSKSTSTSATTSKSTSAAADSTAQTDLIQKEGTYNGQADPHTIEVTVDGEVLSLQVDDSLQPELSKISDGDSIKLEYTVNANKQNELKSISMVSK